MATLTDLRNDIISILLKKHHITEEDFSNIHFISSGGDLLRNSAIRTVLSQLVDSKIIAYCPINEIQNGVSSKKDYWILDKNGSQIPQNIELQSTTCNLISTVLKQYSDFSELNLEIDTLNITEREIQILAVAVSSLIDFLIDGEKDDDDDQLEKNVKDALGE